MCEQQDVNIALKTFMDKLMEVVNKHAPLRKKSVRGNSTPSVDSELRSLFLQRDKDKGVAQKSRYYADRKIYCKLRNQVTKLKHSKKRDYFKQRIFEYVNDSRKLWKTLYALMCKKKKSTTRIVECEGTFITRPADVANYFNNFFTNKVNSLR